MEPDASPSPLIRSLHGAGLLLLLAAIVTWRSIDPAEAQPRAAHRPVIIRQAVSARSAPPPAAHPGIRQEDRLIYFIVSDTEEQQRITDALSCNNCPTSINGNGYVAMVRSSQEKSALVRTVNELNWIRRGLSLTPITVVDLSQYRDEATAIKD